MLIDLQFASFAKKRDISPRYDNTWDSFDIQIEIQACPDNPKGLYPKGGGCVFCGSVEHLKRDCPRKVEKDMAQGVRVGTIGNDLEEEPMMHVGKVKKIKQKKVSKVVAFWSEVLNWITNQNVGMISSEFIRRLFQSIGIEVRMPEDISKQFRKKISLKEFEVFQSLFAFVNISIIWGDQHCEQWGRVQPGFWCQRGGKEAENQGDISFKKTSCQSRTAQQYF